ncbi:unnamed protein product [Effrenium voratum]|nr:unnamed protein product [Effrenium voratum]
MLSARGPRPAWFTPREDEKRLQRTGQGVLGTPRAASGAAAFAAASARHDPAPGVAPAGKAGELLASGGAAARKGLQEGIIVPSPRSPSSMTGVQRRHRQKGEPGEMCLHWGLANAKVPHPGEGYGVKCNKDEDVAQNFRSGQQFGVAEYINTRAEDVYHSTKREPLAKPFLRGHSLPPAVQAPEFPGFGLPLDRSEKGAKDVMFPRGKAPESDEVKALYKRTHGSTEPGEGLSRDYQWPHSVKDNPIFRFGRGNTTSASGAGAKSALSMDCGAEPLSVPNTLIVKDTLASFQEVTTDQLGASRNLMQLQSIQALPQHHAFGKPTSNDPISAGRLIKGAYSLEEQMPDSDLGKCTLRGRRNYETKPLGIPSVRYDKPAPHPLKRSVANAVNYGDDLNAGSLITPTRFQFKGLMADDFRLRREPPEVERLLLGAGFTAGPEVIADILQDAAKRNGDGDRRVSLESVMLALESWVGTQ